MTHKHTQLIASLAKISNPKNDELNIVCSVVQYPEVISLDLIKQNIEKLSTDKDIYFFYHRNFIVIELDMLSNVSPNVILDNKYMKYIKVNIFEFLCLLGHDTDVFLEGYHYINSMVNRESYKFNFNADVKELFLCDNMKYHNVILISNTVSWSIILYLFRIMKISIYGGSITRRHILSTAQLNLVFFLQLLRSLYVDSNIIYESFNKNSILNSKYEKDLSKIIQENKYYSEELVSKILTKKNTESLLFYYARNLFLNKILELLEKRKKIEALLIENKQLKIDIENKKNKNNSLSGIVDSDLSGRSKIKLGTANVFDKENTSKLKQNRDEIINIQKWILNFQTAMRGEGGEVYIPYMKDKINDLVTELEGLLQEYDIGKKDTKITNSITSKREYSTLVEYKSNKDIKKSPNLISATRGKLLTKVLSFINSPSYLELQRIINSYPIDNETQIKIETFLINQGSILLNNRLNQELDINYYKLNPNILKLIQSSVEELNLLLDNFRHNISLQLLKNNKKKEFLNETFELLNNIANETLITYLLGRLLKIISNNNLFNNNNFSSNISIDLSKDLVNYYISKEFKKIKNSENNSLNQFKIENKNRFEGFENDVFLFNFGISLFNLLIEVKLIEIEVIQIDRKTKHTVFIPSKLVFDKLMTKFKFLDLPYKIPMIVKPTEYGRDLETGIDQLGGYLLNDTEFVTPLIFKNPELRDQSIIKNENIIFNMVNYISSVGFKINQQVLDFIMEYGLEYNLIINPNEIHPFESIKKKLTISQKKSLYSFLSKKHLEMNILGLAHIFKNVPELYIPVRIDYRGRLYCVADYLNYQSTELAKALLLFSKGEQINKNDNSAIKFLKVFGANCFGNGIDKNSYKDRIEWVNNNEENILNFKNGILINQADSKLLFIAFCFEYLNYKNSLNNNNTYFTSYFPIQLDATCNGYQHLSLLTGDESLAAELNLNPATEQDIPKDLYTFILLRLTDYYKNKILEMEQSGNTDGNIDSFKKFVSVKIPRKSVKSPIMVKPYNASLLQMTNYFKETLEEVSENNKKFYVFKENKDIKFTNEELILFIQTLNHIIYVEFPKLKTIENYLKKIAVFCSTLNIPIVWALPSGLNVDHYYEGSEAIRLKPFTFKKNTFKLLIGNKKLNKPKQIRALMPNLIHSLDATSLALLVEKFFKDSQFGLKNFYSIHDCFAVTGNNIETLINILKYVYIEIYSDNNYLRIFDEGIINNIKLQFGKQAFNDFTKHIKYNGFDLYYPDIETVIKDNKLKAKYLIK